jgi:hypothetical protein
MSASERRLIVTLRSRGEPPFRTRPRCLFYSLNEVNNLSALPNNILVRKDNRRISASAFLLASQFGLIAEEVAKVNPDGDP